MNIEDVDERKINKLSITHKLILLDGFGNRAEARFKHIVRRTGLSEKAVWRGLNYLIAHGYVIKDEELGFYKLTKRGAQMINSCLMKKDFRFLIARLQVKLSQASKLDELSQDEEVRERIEELMNFIEERIEKALSKRVSLPRGTFRIRE